MSDALSPWSPVRSGRARTLADVEQSTILAVLAAENGNRARAAVARLGIAAATLSRRLTAYHLET